MAVVGGDIVEITFNHPTVGSGVLYPKSNEDSTLNPGGFVNNDDENGIDGSGTAIFQKSRVRSGFEVTLAHEMNLREDLEKVVAIAQSNEEADWTVTHVNGTIYAGKGLPVGAIASNMNAATFPLKVAGSGTWSKL